MLFTQEHVPVRVIIKSNVDQPYQCENEKFIYSQDPFLFSNGASGNRREGSLGIER